ncbi:MAG: FtsX-like permease family protein [bacterium]|nr:FtsX-like permease family protein [bacterium]
MMNLKKPPYLAERLLNFLVEKKEREFILGDQKEFYNEIYRSSGKFKAVLWYWMQVIKSIHRFLSDLIYWSSLMFTNYLKIAFRNISRNKGYTFLNIFGLSTGITCCIFIFLYVQYETSYDSYHKDVNRIFRVIASVESPTGKTVYGGAAHQMTPYVKENLPQAEYIAKVTPWRADEQVRYGENIFNEAAFDIPYADGDILKILTFEFVEGDPNTALSRPKTAIVTNQTARKYFGDVDPMNKILTIGNEDFEITGVIEDLPGNTVFKFNILRSWKTLNPNMFYPRWMNFHTTFIKLAPSEDPENFAEILSKVVFDHAKEDLQSRNSSYESILQPVRDVYLNSSDLVFERSVVGKVLYVYVFSGIGIFIFLIAAINFMNLITAFSSNRGREVGMRKVIGAQRKQLFFQFINESIILTLISFIFAVIFVLLFLDRFNELTQLKIEYSNLADPSIFLVFLITIIVLGFAAGSYPAVLLSSLKPVTVLRGILKSGKRGQGLRRVLVVGQFTLSIGMITGVILFNDQLNYMKDKSLGFEKEQKLIINMQNSGVGRNNYLTVKEEFKKDPDILGATFSTSIPGRSLYYMKMWPTGQRSTNAHDMYWIDADGDFLSVYGLELIAGKNLSDAERTNLDYLPGLVNEAGVEIFGWSSTDEAVNKTYRDRDPKGKMIGVVKDFHVAGLQNEIEPLIIILRGGYRYLTLKINTENISETLSSVEDKFNSLFPGVIFDYFFLDDDFDRQYQKEEQTTRIFGIFTILGIVIASLGLIGLAAFAAEKRTKEVGIRKVLGASIESIISMLTKDFLYLVLTANIIAWPASYYVMDKWLQSFAYRIDIEIGTFLIAGSLAVITALIAVSFQVLKAAYKNPVDSLKYE